MKSLFLKRSIQTLAANLVAFYMSLLARTIRWQIKGLEDAYALWQAPEGLIIAAWHSRIMLIPSGWFHYWRHWKKLKAPDEGKQNSTIKPKPFPVFFKKHSKLHVIVSWSRDGQIIAQSIDKIGGSVIRGSKHNKKKPTVDKRGLQAFAAARKLLRRGEVVLVTPDGPRGPAEVAAPGSIILAQMTGANLMLYGIAAHPSFHAKSWDRLLFPLPFSRGAIVFDGPFRIEKNEDINNARVRIEDRLKAVTREAEKMAGYSAATLSQSDTKQASK